MGFAAGDALAASAEQAALAAAGPALVAHRAVYDLTLASSSGSKGPNTARGRIAFDFSGNSCEGYVQNFRQMTEVQPAEGPSRLSDMRSTTFEDGDAKSFRFRVESTVDNAGVEDVDGRAAKSSDGALSVSLSRPHLVKVDLDQSVVFPTEHLRRIIAAAKSGQHTLEIKVFDGSDSGQKVYETLTVIGAKATSEPKEKAVQVPQLENMPRWPVTISYFEEGKKDSAPAYTLSFDLYENGVSRALKLDYGDFVLAGEMKKLEFLPTTACNK
ncbi:MAG: cell envelope integrity EipB family protein [Hyphomicrobiales bacterium]|nr:cell envelope integrity EipB family protein [Hyphomicrobiales bacterium]